MTDAIQALAAALAAVREQDNAHTKKELIELAKAAGVKVDFGLGKGKMLEPLEAAVTTAARETLAAALTGLAAGGDQPTKAGLVDLAKLAQITVDFDLGKGKLVPELEGALALLDAPAVEIDQPPETAPETPGAAPALTPPAAPVVGVGDVDRMAAIESTLRTLTAAIGTLAAAGANTTAPAAELHVLTPVVEDEALAPNTPELPDMINGMPVLRPAPVAPPVPRGAGHGGGSPGPVKLVATSVGQQPAPAPTTSAPPLGQVRPSAATAQGAAAVNPQPEPPVIELVTDTDTPTGVIAPQAAANVHAAVLQGRYAIEGALKTLGALDGGGGVIGDRLRRLLRDIGEITARS